MSSEFDPALGMRASITRRDFLNGVAIAVGASVMAPMSALAGVSDYDPESAPGYYPPALTGMRGNHEGSFPTAHRLRDGEFWDGSEKPVASGEEYDLVVVGGGISGLAAAHFFRQKAGTKARVLVLDNHDDFGGHAKRNEFEVGGRLLLGYGGTQSIESPGKYSKVSKQVLRQLGIDSTRFYKAYDQKLYEKLQTAYFFNRETFGADRLVVGIGALPWEEFMAKSPLSEQVKRDIVRVYTRKVDYLAGMSRQQKMARLEKMSYADFLTQICKVTPDALPFFQSFTHDLFCVGIDAVPALYCYFAGDDYNGFAYPGFDGLNLGEHGKEEPYIFHFPDGNATIARLLVRDMIPAAVPGKSMDDVVTARADYSRLDQPNNAVRIRLNSTVVKAKEEAGTKQVTVAYVRGGKLQSVRGKACVLACYNGMIPYLCPELPEKQKQALAYLVKAPLVYTHVAIRNWTSFHKLGVHQIESPGCYHSYTGLDFPVSLGGYQFPSHPEEPMVLFMLRTPCKPGLTNREQYRAGRAELLRTPFSTFEGNIRDQLGRMLGPSGFDPERDIQGITVNRWAHGYAYGYNPLFDPNWKDGEQPWVVGRQRFGRIAIANSDAGARAYTDCAIDEAHRAISEVTSLT
jgi:spermidine dehydrogenase